MLPQLLPDDLFAFFLVFARIGAAIMVLPGFGETFVPPRYRLLLSAAITLILTPVVGPSLPPLPASPITLFLLLFGEIVVGLFLGTIARILMAALHIAGSVLSYQAGLANALSFDPVAAEQSSLAATFLSMAGLLVVFALNLHYVMLRALVASYDVFTPGAMPPIDDFSLVVSRVVSETFLLGIQLAAPFIVVGLVFFLGVGLLARLMPQVQVFFVMMPVQVFLGFAVFALTAGAMLSWFAGRFPDLLIGALGG